LARWQQDVQMVTATSVETLQNLLVLLGNDGRIALLATPLVVISQRMAEIAEKLGFARIETAKHAADAAILEALYRLLESHHQD
jgi:uroporphyrinogen-III synthase